MEGAVILGLNIESSAQQPDGPRIVLLLDVYHNH